jgi:mRNA-degrading endonuclease RelE of RelBE toxin-antitoxin system
MNALSKRACLTLCTPGRKWYEYGNTPFAVIYSPEVSDHISAIDSKHHAFIWQKIEQQLQFEPAVVTRNRKPLRQPAPFEAEWEIRFGAGNRFRVLYDVDERERSVHILAIGEKVRDRLLIGGEEIKL